MKNDLTTKEIAERFFNTGASYWRKNGEPSTRTLVLDQMRKKRTIVDEGRKGGGVYGQIITGIDEDWGMKSNKAGVSATILFLEYLGIIEVVREGPVRNGRAAMSELRFHPEELVEEDLEALEELDNWKRAVVERDMTTDGLEWNGGDTRALGAVGSSVTLEEIERLEKYDAVNSPVPEIAQEPLESSPSTFPAEESFSVADAILQRVAEILNRGEPEPQIQYIESPHDVELGKRLYTQTELYNKARFRVGELEDLLANEKSVVVKLNARIVQLNNNIEAMKHSNNSVVRSEFEKMVSQFMTKRESGKDGGE